MVHAQVLIRFLVAPNMLPSPPPASTHAGSRRSGSQSGRSSRHSRVPSEINAPAPETQIGVEDANTDELPATNIPGPAPAPALEPTARTGNTFRGLPVDVENTTGYGMPQGRYHTPQDPFNGPGAPREPTARPLFNSATTNRTNALTRTPTRNHPFSAEVTFGAESFEEYMSQFMYAEVKFKDFRKATIPKFDSAKQDSFVHWYKLFCSTCL